MSNPNRPDFEAVLRTEGPEPGSKSWTKIGAAWQARSGQGLNLVLDRVPPAKATIYLRARKADRPQAAG